MKKYLHKDSFLQALPDWLVGAAFGMLIIFWLSPDLLLDALKMIGLLEY